MSAGTFAAVDLGASSGRVMTARIGQGVLELAEAHRFANRPVRVRGTLHWDVLDLHRGVLDGLRAAARAAGRLDGVGVDSWAVDVGLLDADGDLLGNPVHYRDPVHERGVPVVHGLVPPDELYAVNGLQHLPFNTVFQLAARQGSAALAAARRMLLVPDLVAYWLTGAVGAEVTNASTTGLLDARTRRWATGTVSRLGLDPTLLPPLCEPGDRIGELLPEVLDATGLTGPVPLTAVGSHDTASAVLGVPAAGDSFAYVSCGTWSLVGVELAKPVLTEDARTAGFTNELGVDGTVRFLRNVMGLWLLQESLRTWADTDGAEPDLAALLAGAARLPAFGSVVDAGDPRFLAPGDMPARIAEACAERGEPPPDGRAGTVRCILDSLALAYRRAVDRACTLSGNPAEVVHLVGGGARNTLLCDLAADACDRPVVAGPVEAAALGNALVQARAAGILDGGPPELRRLVRDTQEVRTHRPDPVRARAAARALERLGA
ncbi:carbohydrate kinase [Pseudonocardia sp. EC080610-09]|uniref:rhamnulokinase n=1 Tax=unclassified Pseudonocardia TaxID=2619320 RepID=UPI0006CB504C|nr:MULTISPECIES: rhamnulokinase family protein [unclassified Pseudonocardia]ALE72339.1 carbohydrate kinase [Pseudonocardia sp. EC080625-04]ALL75633.1 carbohydrate kinase [Pseudonocardia sp. EC080610-09]ALL82661.1 carbohydrate kinase [Pseudonocardia sp. EC080619-01]